uniref:Uncharacterized protein n=1 Tax=viral metagenome TaxID=1070528 RepID=A0A6C0DU41_9ZZZZ
MSIMFVANWASWLFNTAYRCCRKTRRLTHDVYTLLTVEPTWVISPSGEFFSSAVFTDLCSENWIYRDSLLYCDGLGKSQKFPILSCEFKHSDDITVSLDDLLEDLRYRGSVVPPLPVLMAAFTIHTKTVYPWRSAHFTAFLKNGTRVEFRGDVEQLPVSA